jgi:hypothetical protein
MVVEVVAVLDPFDPVTDFIPELEQANAALLVIANTMAATKLSNRLDIGSPPFCRPGTCRAATIADPRALDKRVSRPGTRLTAARRENGHISGLSGHNAVPPSPVRFAITRRGATPKIVLESPLQDIQAVSTQCHYRPYRRARGVFGSTSLP